MEHHEMVSDLYQKNMQKAANSKKWRNIVNIIFILLGSFILAINMNTFVEQGKLVPGGFSGLSKLIQRVGLPQPACGFRTGGRAARHPHHRRYPADFGVRRDTKRSGPEPDPKQQRQQWRDGFHCHVSLQQV